MEPAQERGVLWSTKLKGVEGLKNALTSAMEMQKSEFALLILVLLWSSISSLCYISIPFGIGIYILCHCMLEVCDLLFYFDFTGAYSGEIALSLRRVFGL